MAWLVWMMCVAGAILVCIGLIRNDLQLSIRQGVVCVVGLDYTRILGPFIFGLS
jgi:hypothetical protein